MVACFLVIFAAVCTVAFFLFVSACSWLILVLSHHLFVVLYSVTDDVRDCAAVVLGCCCFVLVFVVVIVKGALLTPAFVHQKSKSFPCLLVRSHRYLYSIVSYSYNLYWHYLD